jgi:hypothetical protein
MAKLKVSKREHIVCVTSKTTWAADVRGRQRRVCEVNRNDSFRTGRSVRRLQGKRSECVPSMSTEVISYLVLLMVSFGRRDTSLGCFGGRKHCRHGVRRCLRGIESAR